MKCKLMIFESHADFVSFIANYFFLTVSPGNKDRRRNTKNIKYYNMCIQLIRNNTIVSSAPKVQPQSGHSMLL